MKVESLLPEDVTHGLPSGVYQPLLRADEERLDLLMITLHSFFAEGIRALDMEDAERRLKLKV